MANGSLSHFLSYFSGVWLSSPFLKNLLKKVATNVLCRYFIQHLFKYKIYYGMEYLTKKFFAVQTPKKNLKSQPTIIMEPSKLVTLLFAVPSCIFCSNIQGAFSFYLHYLYFFHKSQIKFCSNHLRIV